MNALFTFTIGPVKSLVENSRKMIDLYGGSSLLSDLTSTAINKFKDIFKDISHEIIFPYVEDNKDNNIPNRFVAKITNFDEHSLAFKEKAELLVKEINKKFIDIAVKAFKNFDITSESDIDKITTQLNDIISIYWLYMPYPDENYNKAYKKISYQMQDVKSLKAFKQNTEPWGRKCSLFNEYNAIFVRKNAKNKLPNNTNEDYIIDISKIKKLEHIVKPNEALSAIALLKRIYKKNENTHNKSTREMLLEAYYKYILHNESYMKANRTDLSDIIYDYKNSIEPSEDDYSPDTIKIGKAIYEQIKKNNIFLSSYYACLKMDGDDMGNIYNNLTEVEQRELSKNICEFAINAKEIVESLDGICVYAGGEDILAFLPITTLFEGMKELHEAFKSKTKKNLSMGVSVSHLMQPLKQVLSSASEMERVAKSVKDKNAFAIAIVKRGGELRKTNFKFNNYGALCCIDKIITILHSNQCSKAVVHDLCLLLEPFVDTEIDVCLLEVLIKKVIQGKNIPEDVTEYLIKLWSELQELPKQKVLSFINTIDIIGFLAREVI